LSCSRCSTTEVGTSAIASSPGVGFSSGLLMRSAASHRAVAANSAVGAAQGAAEAAA
jgi:hypothetical protein